jgi:hypothetical protein
MVTVLVNAEAVITATLKTRTAPRTSLVIRLSISLSFRILHQKRLDLLVKFLSKKYAADYVIYFAVATYDDG